MATKARLAAKQVQAQVDQAEAVQAIKDQLDRIEEKLDALLGGDKKSSSKSTSKE